MSRPHGGFWHGQLPPGIRTSNVRSSDPMSYGTGDPSLVFSTQPSAPTSCVAAKMNPDRRSNDVPPQFDPPSPPGKTSVLFIGAPSARYAQGVNGPALDTPPFFAISSWQARTCSAVVSAAVTRSVA